MALLYALLTTVATLIGGALPLFTRLRHLEHRYLLGFASGAMVAIAFLDLIPQMEAHNAVALATGFFSLYFVEKLVLIHACGEAECEAHAVGWIALVGIVAESLVDGVGIGVGYAVAPAVGMLIAAAVFVHELPRGFATSAIMRGSGYGRRLTLAALALDAGLTPVGTLLAGVFPTAWFEPLLGFTAGAFLYVGASDLLPEAHRRFNRRVVLSTLGGAGLIPLLGGLLRL